MATEAAAGAGFGKVGGVTVEVQAHVTGAVSDGGVQVGRSIIEKPNGCVTSCLRYFRLPGSNEADGKEYGSMGRTDTKLASTLVIRTF